MNHLFASRKLVPRVFHLPCPKPGHQFILRRIRRLACGCVFDYHSAYRLVDLYSSIYIHLIALPKLPSPGIPMAIPIDFPSNSPPQIP